jgi:uncharacterized protein involved in outer membrane biogenesis
MKRLFKWLFRLLLVLVVLVGLLVFFRDPLARSLAERYLTEATGLEAIIGHLHVHLGEPVITLENFRLMNPAGLSEHPFLDASEVTLEYDPKALSERALHVRSLRLNLTDVLIVRGADGSGTLETLADRLEQRRAEAARSAESFELRGIDVLALSVGRFKYVDFREPTRSQEVWMGLKNLKAKDLHTAKDIDAFLVRAAKEKGIDLNAIRQVGSNTNAPTRSIPAPSPSKATTSPQP